MLMAVPFKIPGGTPRPHLEFEGIWGIYLCVCNKMTCVDNLVDVDDRLLIF